MQISGQVMLLCLTHEWKPGMNPGVDGDSVGEWVPRLNLVVERRQHDLLENVQQNPLGKERQPRVQQFQNLLRFSHRPWTSVNYGNNNNIKANK